MIEKLFKLSDKECSKVLNTKNIFKSKYLRLGAELSVKNILFDCIIYKNVLFYTTHTGEKEYRIINFDTFSNCYTPLTKQDIEQLKLQYIYNNVEKWDYDKFFNIVCRRFIDHYGEDRVDCHSPYITIYFPEIIIKNSFEQEHTIRDLYLRLYINYNGLRLDCIYRTTYTISEIFAEYVFSHISTYTFTGYNESFCFGKNNPIVNIVSSVSSSRQNVIKNLQVLPYMIDEYLSWESLEGTPYKKIEDVLNNNKLLTDVLCPTYSQEELILYIKDNLKHFTYNYELDDDSNYNVRLSLSSKEDIENMLSEKYPELSFYKKNGYSVTPKSQIEKVTRYQGASCPSFKGEAKTLNIIQQDMSSLNLPIKIHQYILNKTIIEIENKFETFLINKNNE